MTHDEEQGSQTASPICVAASTWLGPLTKAARSASRPPRSTHAMTREG
jgi:hypothetical protein